jgi:hypothetical protein
MNNLSPQLIYVCLYDHRSSNNAENELEFSRGDLLYIINTDGPNFYVGHRLILPWLPASRPRIGLVFKDYIQAAYERTTSAID